LPDQSVNSAADIHKFELGGDYFLIDPASGAVHVADKEVFEHLDNPENDEIQAELDELREAGLLFSEDDCHEYAETSVDAPLKALCLHVSHDCNLQCGYCFADSAVRERSVMSVGTAKAAIDFMVANSGERTELEADFFGGEPLMAWETVVACVDYARSVERETGKHFRFTVTTNGLLLDDGKIDYINREMSNCVLSLDGRKAVNDRIRPAKNGRGSFDLVIPKFRKLVAGRDKRDFTDWYVRGTFTAYNLDFAEDVIEMARLGFRHVSIEPVTASPEADYAIKPEHIPVIFEQYERLYRLIRDGELTASEYCDSEQLPPNSDGQCRVKQELPVNFFHFNVDLSGGPCVIRRLRGCGCGNEYLAVTPSGDMYPCHRFVGDERQNMGKVTDKSLNTEIKEYFTKTHIYSKTDCSGCWARFYCSGGCNASSYESFGDCRKTDSESVECLMMKKRLECAIALSALKATKNS
jgi:uncharacterized protein